MHAINFWKTYNALATTQWNIFESTCVPVRNFHLISAESLRSIQTIRPRQQPSYLSYSCALNLQTPGHDLAGASCT